MIAARSLYAATICALALFAIGCLDDWNIDGQPFSCRGPEDCISGFVCDEIRGVCVSVDDQQGDAGLTDTATAATAGEDQG